MRDPLSVAQQEMERDEHDHRGKDGPAA